MPFDVLVVDQHRSNFNNLYIMEKASKKFRTMRRAAMKFFKQYSGEMGLVISVIRVVIDIYKLHTPVN